MIEDDGGGGGGGGGGTLEMCLGAAEKPHSEAKLPDCLSMLGNLQMESPNTAWASLFLFLLSPASSTPLGGGPEMLCCFGFASASLAAVPSRQRPEGYFFNSGRRLLRFDLGGQRPKVTVTSRQSRSHELHLSAPPGGNLISSGSYVQLDWRIK